MAKPGRRSTSGGTESSLAKRDGLVGAAFETLRSEGFARASARAIAVRAGCNSALIFYYFGSVNELLVEALARSSRAQLAKYEGALADVSGVAELVDTLRVRFAEDLASGHVKVVAEMVGASASDEDLRDAVFEHVGPWIDLTARTLGRIPGAGGLGEVVSVEQLAFVVVSSFLGFELLASAVGDEEMIGGLLESAQRVAGLVAAVLPALPAAPVGEAGRER